MACDAQSKEVEKRDTKRNSHTGPQHGRVIDHLVPPTGQIEERGLVGELPQEGHKDQNRQETEETLEADGNERRNRIAAHDLLFDYELRCSAIEKRGLTALAYTISSALMTEDNEQELREGDEKHANQDLCRFWLFNRFRTR